MRMKITLPIAVSIALAAEFMPLTPAYAGHPAPTPHASASAGTVWGGGTRRPEQHQADPDDDAKRSAGNGNQTATSTTTIRRKTVAPPLSVPLCEDNNSAYRCRLPETNKTSAKTKKHKKAKTPTPTQLREVVAQLELPDATPRFGPDPSVNEWKMLAVGFPIWLWTDRPTHLTTTAHHDGLDFTLTATWTSTTFTMGDGHSKACSATTIRPKQIKPATTPSPTCGYTYQTRSKPGHPYTVTAATHWQINWATNGHHGTFTHTYTGSRTLDIGELHSLING